MPRNIEMQHAPRTVADDEEAVKDTERESWDREAIHPRDEFPMIPQEGEPTFGSARIFRRPAHSAGNSSPGDVQAQHQ